MLSLCSNLEQNAPNAPNLAYPCLFGICTIDSDAFSEIDMFRVRVGVAISQCTLICESLLHCRSLMIPLSINGLAFELLVNDQWREHRPTLPADGTSIDTLTKFRS
jgi:hypothetical protein